jgi:hypothetical protein
MGGAIVAAMWLVGCSSGQVGQTGKVRFSLVDNYPDTPDFTSHVATGAGLLLQLEFVSAGLETVNPGLALQVQDGSTPSTTAGNSAKATVLPLGFAQYAVSISTAGSYTIVATQGTTALDFVPITVADVGSLRWHNEAILTTTSGSGSSTKTCSTTPAVSDVTLKSNDTLTIDVVPQDSKGNPLLGLLQLTAMATGPVSLSGALLGQGATPNQLTVDPSGTLGSTAQITVSDSVSGKTLSLTLPTSSSTDSCST